MNLTATLAKQSSRMLVAIAIALFAAVWAVHYSVRGSLLQASIFYLIPISFSVWYLKFRAGAIAIAASVVASLLVDSTPSNHQLFGDMIYWNNLVRFGLFMSVSLVLAEMRHLYEEERTLSRVDHLTGIANRRAFLEAANAECERARRVPLPLTVAFLDLDGFKALNDRLGHSQGDAALVGVAKALSGSVRRVDFVGRMGGDEFALLLPTTDPDAARFVLRKLHATLNRHMHEHGWPITASIGAVTFLQAPDSADQLLRAADKMMYAAKLAGKNQLRLARQPA